MERYTSNYLRNHCVDFYFSFRGKPIHVVTDGCLVPNSLSDVTTNRKLQQRFANSYTTEITDDCNINPDYYDIINDRIKSRFEQLLHDGKYSDIVVNDFIPSRQDILVPHLYMSRLGFYSYACVWDNEEESDCHFILVTSPKDYRSHENICDLPQCSEQDILMDDDMKQFRWESYMHENA